VASEPATQLPSLTAIHELIAGDADQLSAKLQAHRRKLFPPASQKTLRSFSSGEAAKLIGINDGYLRQLSLDGKGPRPETSPTGRRSYSCEDIRVFALFWTKVGRPVVGICRTGEPVSVFRSYLSPISRWLRKDDHRSASGTISRLARVPRAGHRFGSSGEPLGVTWLSTRIRHRENETLYGAIRYDGDRRELRISSATRIFLAWISFLATLS